MAKRGTSNRNKTGNSYDRRRRREWMIERFGVPRQSDGRKTRVRCAHCQKMMRAEGRKNVAGDICFTWEVDRITCGHDGGRYVRGNIQPSCRSCNQTRCSRFCRFGAPRIVKHFMAGVVQTVEAKAIAA